MSTASTLRVGIIGANWGFNHIEAWRAVPGVEVSVICTARESTARAAAERAGIPRAAWDATTMFADPTLDIIDVTPRPTIRIPLCLQALGAGKHLLQPLPFAIGLEAAASLRSAASQQRVIAMVENLHRYSPAFRQAKFLLDNGFLGQLYTVKGHVRTGILLNPPAGYAYEWITDAASGASALRNFGAHLLHVLTWLFGSIEAVNAAISIQQPRIHFSDGSSKSNETADSACVLTRYANGATGVVDVSWCTAAAEGFCVDAVGSLGRLVIRAEGLGPQRAELWCARRADKSLMPCPIEERFSTVPGLPLRADPRQPRTFELAAMCSAMAEAIRSGGASRAAPDFNEAYEVMRIVEAAYASVQSGCWVEVATHPITPAVATPSLRA
jgi:predicted dehydrogenase